MTATRYQKGAICLAGALLAATGVAKIWSAFGTARALMVLDPIMGIPFKYLLAGVGVLEILVAAICFFRRYRPLAVMLVAWLSTCFLLYRGGLWWVGWKQPCGCMGSLTGALHIKPEMADNIAKVILMYLLLSSYGLLIWQWRETRLAMPMRKLSRAQVGAAPSALLVLFLGLTLPCRGSDATGYKVSGFMSFSQFWNKNAATNQSCRFEVSVLPPLSLYKVIMDGREISFGCNGRDTYILIQDQEARRRLKMPGYIGYVFPGDYPTWSFSTFTALPWVAYASGGGLAQRATNGFVKLPAPWLASWSMLAAHMYKARYEPLQGGHGLPKALEYVVDAGRVESLKHGAYDTLVKPSDAERDKVIMRISALQDYSAPEGVYRVDASTNFGANVIPTAFTFEKYQINARASGIHRSLMSRTVGEVTSVELISALSPYPRSSDGVSETLVADYRFAAQERDGPVFLSYSTSQTQGWLTDKSDIRLRSLIAKDAAKRKKLIGFKISKRFVAAALCLASVGGLVFLIRHTFKLSRPADN